MSRIAKQPIPLPTGTTIAFSGDMVTVTGPKGTLARPFSQHLIEIKQEGDTVVLAKRRNDNFTKALWGTYASHIKNMLQGVNTPYAKKLILEGVCFKSEVKGKSLDLALGFSHPVKVEIPDGLTVTAEKNVITVTGIDKESVGAFTAKVRALKKPEPYKGKGFHYDDEVVRRKQGKKSA